MSIDNYYSRSEVSNSELTELKNILHPRMQFGDKKQLSASVHWSMLLLQSRQRLITILNKISIGLTNKK